MFFPYINHKITAHFARYCRKKPDRFVSKISLFLNQLIPDGNDKGKSDKAYHKLAEQF